MSKKYKPIKEESSVVNEPSVGYNTAKQQKGPCVFTIEEIEKQIIQGEKEIEAGLGTPHEELKRRFKV